MAQSASKRSTIYFDKKAHKALRLKAAETHRSVSHLVNEAVKQSLLEYSEASRHLITTQADTPLRSKSAPYYEASRHPLDGVYM